MPALSLKRLWVLMVSAFVDMIGFALILPLLPLYAKEFGADPFTIGILLASFAFAQLATAPMWGKVSDRIGRRPVIIGGQCLAALAFLVFAAADSVWLLLLSRLAQGAGGGTLSAVQAYVVDSAGPDERARAIGWITACTSAGVMIGPGIASLAVRWSTSAPGLIAAVLCVLNILFAWRWLPESASPEQRSGGPPRRPIRQSLAQVLRRPTAPAHTLIWIYAGGMLAFMSVAGLMSLYLSDRFGITKETIGGYYVVIGMVSVIMRALVLGFLVKHLGEVRVLRLGALSLIIGLVSAPLASGPWQFLLAVVFVPIGTALLFPSTTSLISRHSAASEMGQTLGVQQAFGGVSRFLAPIWAGAVYQVYGSAMPFWISAGVMVLLGLFSLRLHPGETLKQRLRADGARG
ncbi:MAG: MFS transporter [bacterium]|nr:MFS transporter [bacterium]